MIPTDNNRRSRPARGFVAGIKWWWNTRIRSWWTVRLPAHQQQKRQAGQKIQFEKIASELTPPSTGTTTAILTVYKRSEFLTAQIAALKNQTHPPAEIWVWTNSSDILPTDFSSEVDRVVVSNTNWKFWGRFAIGNLARTTYLCILDDDVLPEPRWIENCISTYDAGTKGILGGSGVILPEAGGYSSKHKVGWNGNHFNEPAEVDLVGHAWFFRKEYLQYMWIEQPHSWENGEDIHFSYMALKHGGLSTWVPPHPDDDQSLWSCRPDFGKTVGRTKAATHKSVGHHGLRDEIVDAYRSDGWKLTTERQRTSQNTSPVTTGITNGV